MGLIASRTMHSRHYAGNLVALLDPPTQYASVRCSGSFLLFIEYLSFSFVLLVYRFGLGVHDFHFQDLL